MKSDTGTGLLKGDISGPAGSLYHRSLGLLMSGQAVAAMAGLLYGKATALYISPTELGYYNLLFGAMTLVYAISVSPIIQSFKSSLSRESTEDAFRFHSQLLMLVYAVALIAVGIAAQLSKSGILLLIWGAAVGQGIYALGNDYLNIVARYRAYTQLQVGYSLVNLLLFLIFIVGVNWQHATGLWVILAILNGLFACLAIQNLRSIVGSDIFRLQKLVNGWQSVRFVAFRNYVTPLIGLAIWSWLVSYADRYLIRHYLTDADVGQYAMGYSLGSKLLVLVAPFVTHLTGEAIRQKGAGASVVAFHATQRKYIAGYGLLGALVCLVFFLGRNWFGVLLLSEAYKPAFAVGPVIAISYLILTIIYLLEVKWYVYGTTRFILWHYVAGAIFNVALNIWLIPKFGINGASFAMVGSTLCQLGVALYIHKN